MELAIGMGCWLFLMFIGVLKIIEFIKDRIRFPKVKPRRDR